MSPSRLTILFFIAACLCGCHENRPVPPPPPATPYTAERLQAEFQEVDPSARVGLVDAVKPSDRLAAVSHLDPADFRVGDPISFMDSQKNLICQGTVVRKVDELLIVQYTHRMRGLHKGDLAVRVKM